MKKFFTAFLCTIALFSTFDLVRAEGEQRIEKTSTIVCKGDTAALPIVFGNTDVVLIRWYTADGAIDDTFYRSDWTGYTKVVQTKERTLRSSAEGCDEAGCYSTDLVKSAGYIRMVVSDVNSFTAFGLSKPANVESVYYSSIDYAIYLAAGNLIISENGVYRTPTTPLAYPISYKIGDTLTVELKGGKIIYTKNGQTIYTNNVAPGVALYGDVSFVSNIGEQEIKNITFWGDSTLPTRVFRTDITSDKTFYKEIVTLNGSSSSELSFDVSQVELPMLNIHGATAICKGNSVTLHADHPSLGTPYWSLTADFSNAVAGDTFSLSNIDDNQTIYVRNQHDQCYAAINPVEISVDTRVFAATVLNDTVYSTIDNKANLSATPMYEGVINWYTNPGLTEHIGTGSSIPYPDTDTTLGLHFFYANETTGVGCQTPAGHMMVFIFEQPNCDNFSIDAGNDTLIEMGKDFVLFPLVSDTVNNIRIHWSANGFIDTTYVVATGQATAGLTWVPTNVISGGGFTKSTSTECDAAGAFTREYISSQGHISTVVNSVDSYKAFGLTKVADAAKTPYTDIDYAFYTAKNILTISEKGVYKYAGVCQIGDTLKIVVTTTNVKYYKNSTLLVTTTVAPTFPLVGDLSFASPFGENLYRDIMMLCDGGDVTAANHKGVKLNAHKDGVFTFNLSVSNGTCTAQGSRVITIPDVAGFSTFAADTTSSDNAFNLNPKVTNAIHITNAVNNIKFIATPAYVGANISCTVAKNGGTKNAISPNDSIFAFSGLETGSYAFEFTVVAVDAVATKKYTVNVIKAPSRDASLKTLAADTTSVFSLPIQANNTLSLNGEIRSISFEAIPTHDSAKVSCSIAKNGGTAVAVAKVNGKFAISGLVTANYVVTFIVKAEDTNVSKTYTINIERRSSTDASLKELPVNQNPVLGIANMPIPTLDTLRVDATVSTVRFTPVPNHDSATVTCMMSANGETAVSIDETDGYFSLGNLNTGIYTFTFTVTAEDKTTTRTYTAVVKRGRSGNADLKRIAIDTTNEFYNLAISPSNTVIVSSRITEVKLAAEAAHDSASFVCTVAKNGGSAQTLSPLSGVYTLSNLTTGTYTVLFTVTAEDPDVRKVYTVTVIRSASVETGLIAQNPDQTVVDGIVNLPVQTGTALEVTSDVDVVRFRPTPSHDSAIVTASVTKADGTTSTIIPNSDGTFNLDNLHTGTYTFTFTVTAEDPTVSRPYVVTVIRMPSTDASLKTIKVDSGAVVVFNNLADNSNLDISSNVNAISISAETTHDSAEVVSCTVSKNGGAAVSLTANNNNAFSLDSLKTGTYVFTLTAASEAGNTRSYTVTVRRAPSTDATVKTFDFTPSSAGSIIQNDDLPENAVMVSAETDEIVFNTIPNHDSATVECVVSKNGGPLTPLTKNENNQFKLEDLSTGSYDITFTITAENRNIYNEFSYKVIRAASTDARLASISVNSSLIEDFSMTKLTYNLSVDNDTRTISISGRVAHDSATYTGAVTGASLKVGENKFYLVVTAEDTSVHQTYIVTVDRAKSLNANLDSLIVNNNMVAGFNANTPTYTLNVANNVTTANIRAVAADTTATISGNLGSNTLNVGDNVFNVLVTAQNPTQTKNYTITIRRAPSSDATLKSISVNGTAISTFHADTLNYTIPVLNGANMLTLAAATSHANATVSGTVSSAISIPTGESTFVLTVTAEDGTTQRPYVVNVVRAKSTNANLSGITVNGSNQLTPAFSANTTEYTYTVSNEVVSATIDAVKADATATLAGTVANAPLTVGENRFEITVKAEDTNYQRTYVVTVTRLKSTNAHLSALAVNGTPVANFSQTDFVYSVDFPNDTTHATITASVAHDSAIISGTLSKALNVGNNSFVLTVTAEDGTTQLQYTVNVLRAKSTNAYLRAITINGDTVKPFNADTLTYTVRVGNDITKASIDGIVADATANLSGKVTNQNLNVGSNSFQLFVTAENISFTKIYRITIIRDSSSNAKLNTIAVNGTAVAGFNADTHEYTVGVQNSVHQVSITATTMHNNARIAGLVTNVAIPVGDTTFRLTVTAENKSTQLVYDIKIVRDSSSNANLSAIFVNNEAISGFSSSNTAYRKRVSGTTETATISATLADATATYVGAIENAPLAIDSNKFELVVTAQNGRTTKTYTVYVVRDDTATPEVLSTNADLSSLSVNGISVDNFDANTLSYIVDVDYETNTASIYAETDDAYATVVRGMVSDSSLNVGENIFNVVVVAQDDTVSKTYTITVIRARSTNAHLSSISFNGTAIANFHTDTLAYTISVGNETNRATLTVDKAQADATITGLANNANLNVGTNTFNIVVTAADGTTQLTYVVNIIRAKSTNADLSLISINSVAVSDFDANTTLYSFDYPNSTQTVTITAIPSDLTASISGTVDNKVLKVGINTFEIKVVAQDTNYKKTYTVNITRAASSDASLSGIKVNGTAIANFSASTLNYEVTVEHSVDTLTLVGTATHDSAIVSGNLVNVDLAVGENEYSITVTAEDESTQAIYTVTVIRQDSTATPALSTNANLTGFTLSTDSVAGFDPNVLDYIVNVAHRVDQISITAHVEDSLATVGNIVDMPLEIGNNVFGFEVVAQDTNYKKLYSVTIIRAADVDTPNPDDEEEEEPEVLSKNADLDDVVFNAGNLSPVFHPNTVGYMIYVDNDVDDISIKGVAADRKAKVEGNIEDAPLKVGNNVFSLNVVAHDTTVRKIYHFTVFRAKATDVQEKTEVSFNVFLTPNPAHDQFGLYFTGKKDRAWVKIYSMQGGAPKFEQLLEKETIHKIPLDNYTPGIYIVIVDNQRLKLIVN